MGLPFSRVAILEPDLTFTDPHAADFDRRLRGELRDWLAKASRNSADACYARVQQLPTGTALAILDFLAAEIHLLAPSTLYPLEVNPLGYHHRSHETALLPPGACLQGISCHGLAELQWAENSGFDYAFLSPVFSTATHPDAVPLGLKAFEAACRAVKIPVIALGGVTAANANACIQAGAAGWAAIRAFMH